MSDIGLDDKKKPSNLIKNVAVIVNVFAIVFTFQSSLHSFDLLSLHYIKLIDNLSSGITHLVGSGFVDSDHKSVVETYLSETVTTMSTVWTATDHDNPSAPLASITLPEMMTSDDTSHETLRTESTTDLSHSTEVQTTSTVVTPTRTATISFSTSLVTTPNSSNNLTLPLVTSTTVTTSESPPTTISPTCNFSVLIEIHFWLLYISYHIL